MLGQVTHPPLTPVSSSLKWRWLAPSSKALQRVKWSGCAVWRDMCGLRPSPSCSGGATLRNYSMAWSVMAPPPTTLARSFLWSVHSVPSLCSTLGTRWTIRGLSLEREEHINHLQVHMNRAEEDSQHRCGTPEGSLGNGRYFLKDSIFWGAPQWNVLNAPDLCT